MYIPLAKYKMYKYNEIPQVIHLANLYRRILNWPIINDTHPLSEQNDEDFLSFYSENWQFKFYYWDFSIWVKRTYLASRLCSATRDLAAFFSFCSRSSASNSLLHKVIFFLIYKKKYTWRSPTRPSMQFCIKAAHLKRNINGENHKTME